MTASEVPPAPPGRLGRAALLAALSIVFGWMTVNRTAPTQATADALMFSIMSLQNVTLFYWGQDRLLNALPFVFQPVRDPATNALLILTTYGASFFGLMAVAAHILARRVLRTARPEATLVIAAIASAAVVAALPPTTVYFLLVEQGQYGLSYLLILLGHVLAFPVRRPVVLRWLGFTALVAVALGLNPGAIVFLLGGYAALAVLSRDSRRPAALAAVLSAVLFVAWLQVSALVPMDRPPIPADGTPPLQRALIGFDRVYGALVSGLAALVVVAVAALSIGWFGNARARWAAVAAVALCPLFVAAFAQYPWTAVNGYNVRYFCVVYLVVAPLVAVGLFLPADRWSRWPASVLGLLAGLFVATSLWSPPVAPGTYAVVTRYPPPPPGGAVRFHAGDYWQGWPAVFSDMARGAPAYGFMLRAEGNLDNLVRAGRAALSGKGIVVQCHGAPEECIAQVQRFLPEAAPQRCDLAAAGGPAIIFGPAGIDAAGSCP